MYDLCDGITAALYDLNRGKKPLILTEEVGIPCTKVNKTQFYSGLRGTDGDTYAQHAGYLTHKYYSERGYKAHHFNLVTRSGVGGSLTYTLYKGPGNVYFAVDPDTGIQDVFYIYVSPTESFVENFDVLLPFLQCKWPRLQVRLLNEDMMIDLVGQDAALNLAKAFCAEGHVPLVLMAATALSLVLANEGKVDAHIMLVAQMAAYFPGGEERLGSVNSYPSGMCPNYNRVYTQLRAFLDRQEVKEQQ